MNDSTTLEDLSPKERKKYYHNRASKAYETLRESGYNPIALAQHARFYRPVKQYCLGRADEEALLHYAERISFRNPNVLSTPPPSHDKTTMIGQLEKTGNEVEAA